MVSGYDWPPSDPRVPERNQRGRERRALHEIGELARRHAGERRETGRGQCIGHRHVCCRVAAASTGRGGLHACGAVAAQGAQQLRGGRRIVQHGRIARGGGGHNQRRNMRVEQCGEQVQRRRANQRASVQQADEPRRHQGARLDEAGGGWFEWRDEWRPLHFG